MEGKMGKGRPTHCAPKCIGKYQIGLLEWDLRRDRTLASLGSKTLQRCASGPDSEMLGIRNIVDGGSYLTDRGLFPGFIF